MLFTYDWYFLTWWLLAKPHPLLFSKSRSALREVDRNPQLPFLRELSFLIGEENREEDGGGVEFCDMYELHVHIHRLFFSWLRTSGGNKFNLDLMLYLYVAVVTSIFDFIGWATARWISYNIECYQMHVCCPSCKGI